MGRPQFYQLLPEMTVPRGFLRETVTYEIEAVADSKPLPGDYSLALNDIPLQPIDRRGYTSFLFNMEFYAGDLRLLISRGNRAIRIVDLAIDPDTSKLTREEYLAMIADIVAATLALYRLSAVTAPSSAAPRGTALDIATLELIRSNFDQFERSVARVVDQPVRTLRSITVQNDIMRARRITDRAIGGALRGRSRAASAAEAAAAPAFVGALGGRWIPRISEDRRYETVDIYENRALLGFMRSLDLLLSEFGRRLTNENAVQTPTHQACVARVAQWRVKLSALMRRAIFADLSPEPALYATSIFRTHPDYAAAFSAMSRMRYAMSSSRILAPALPLDKTYELYELWCYVRFLAAVAERFPHARPTIAHLLEGSPAPNGLGRILASGAVTEIPLSPAVRLFYQRRITPASAPDGARTLLVDVVPDMMLCRRSPQGICTDIVILDAKYRVGGSLLDGLRDLHVYRDAILGATDERLVRAAVALAPSADGPSIAATAIPTDRPSAFKVTPRQESGIFSHLLDAALSVLGEPA